MPWTETSTTLSANKTVAINAQDALHMIGYQPFLTLIDTNSGKSQSRIQNADGKLVFYTQSALNSGLPTVIFNTLTGAPPPSAIEIHAQDGIQTVGYQPFLTLTDANAGYAKAKVQNADGKLVFYTQGGIAGSKPAMALDGPTGDVLVTGNLTM